jgi:hypothetical protein
MTVIPLWLKAIVTSVSRETNTVISKCVCVCRPLFTVAILLYDATVDMSKPNIGITVQVFGRGLRYPNAQWIVEFSTKHREKSEAWPAAS